MATESSMKAQEVNWRANAKATDVDPDDELLETTPADVVAVLGFDPKEIEEEKEPVQRPSVSDRKFILPQKKEGA